MHMIVVTGASGHLGRLVIEGLLKKVPANQIVAAVRTPAKAADLSALGVVVREADYFRPETLTTAFAGATKVLLISSNELGKRLEQHTAVIEASKTAGVQLLAYTSLLRADTSTLGLAPEHKATEEAIIGSGIPYVLLRNGWYLENHTAALAPTVEHGVLLGASGDGRFAAAGRRDYADAAVTVLTAPGHENKIYELAGDTSYTRAELAAETAHVSGKPVVYKNLTEKEYETALLSFGLPAELAELLADSDTHVAKGELDSQSHDLSGLIGRPTTPLAAAVAAVLKA